MVRGGVPKWPYRARLEIGLSGDTGHVGSNPTSSATPQNAFVSHWVEAPDSRWTTVPSTGESSATPSPMKFQVSPAQEALASFEK